MTTYLVNQDTVEKILEGFRNIQFYVKPEKRDEMLELIRLIELVKFDGIPVEEPTMKVSIGEIVRLHEKIAEAETIKRKIMDALVDVKTLVVHHEDSEDAVSREVPVVSEAFLYDTIGKDDARSFMARIDCVAEAAGIGWREMDANVNNRFRSARRWEIKATFPTVATRDELIREFRAYLKDSVKEGDSLPSLSGWRDNPTARWFGLNREQKEWLHPKVVAALETGAGEPSSIMVIDYYDHDVLYGQ